MKNNFFSSYLQVLKLNLVYQTTKKIIVVFIKIYKTNVT